MKWLLLPVLVVASAASAQTTLLAPVAIHLPSDTTSTSLVFSAAECGSKLTLQWSFQATAGYPCSTMALWATSGSCGETPGTADISYDQVPQISLTTLRQSTFTVSIADLPGFATTGCGASGVQVTHTICGVVTTASDVTCIYTKTVQKAQFSLVYDTKPPSAPGLDSIDALDSSLRVHFNVDADTATVESWAKIHTDTDYTKRGSVPAADGALTIDGLTNDTDYDVVLVGVDSAGNTSGYSNVGAGRPVLTVGFWGAYRNGGGSDPGGCAAAPGFPLICALVLLKRRRS